MDDYGKRLLLVAAMIGVAALGASLIPRQAAADSDIEPQAETAFWDGATVTAAEQADLVLAQYTPAQQGTGFYVTLRTEAGRPVTLYTATGAPVQTVTADADGDATFGDVQPGRYRVGSGEANGEFLLLENAALKALSGTLWSDGELLHLTDTPTVCLRLQVDVPAALVDKVVTVSLTAMDDTEYSRSFIAGSPGAHTVEFPALLPGPYLARQNGELVQTLWVSGEAAQEQTLGD